MGRLTPIAILIAGLLLAVAARAGDERAQVNFMLHCQGCHLPEGQGFGEKVPRLKNFLGYFLHSAEGRQFIVRVPGVATSQLPDDQLAELMNWLLVTYSEAQLPDGYQPYTAKEVSVLRLSPEADPLTTRKVILNTIARDVPALALELSTYQKIASTP